MALTLREAARSVARDRTTILRAIRSGTLSAIRDPATGAWLIEPAELYRIYPPAERTAAQDGDSLSALERSGDAQAAAQVEIRELRAQLDAQERTIEDLRRRLDAADEDRRRIMMVLTDARAPPPAKRSWWRRG